MPTTTTQEHLDSAAYYFLLAAGGEPGAGQGTVITVDPDGGVSSRPYQHLEEARALASVLSNGQHGYREVYLLAHEDEPALFEYRAGDSHPARPLPAEPGVRERLSSLADMS